MDDRQRKVEAGAGLQESRLNQDFIDLLKKYGTPTLLVLLIIMASYVGWQRYSQWQEGRTDRAFAELDNASNVPAVLLSIAADWDGQGSVWEIATIRAARAYLTAARTRTEIGVPLEGADASAALSDDRVRASLEEAGRLFQTVLDRTRNTKPIFAQDARWGLATVSMSLARLDEADRQRHLDAARQHLNAFVEAGQGRDANQVAVGTARLQLLDLIESNPVVIYESAQLPEEARFVADPAFNPMDMVRDTAAPRGGRPSEIPEGATDIRRLTPEEIQRMISDMELPGPVPADPEGPVPADPPADPEQSGPDQDGP